MSDCPACGYDLEIEDPAGSVGDIFRCPNCRSELELQTAMDQDWNEFPMYYFDILVPGNGV